ncbi:hypothetical protein [Arhodomonas sp. SL1]|uniref:hypothetical protein n=1 Tax=Arhodomonas sp. SL1 TaxID=3425691 RepID=UPI003F8855E3
MQNTASITNDHTATIPMDAEEYRESVAELRHLLGVETLETKGRQVCPEAVAAFFAPGDAHENAEAAREIAVRAKLTRMVGASSWAEVARIAPEVFKSLDYMTFGQAITLALEHGADPRTDARGRLVDAIPEARFWGDVERMAPGVVQACHTRPFAEALEAAEVFAAESEAA